jgi:asparagine synthase (glutamine-hydrolysing)
MGASIEARVPWLAHQIVNYTGSLREEMLIHRFETKYLLKKLAERYVPRSNIYRKKVGFELPLRDWLRSELKDLVNELIGNSVQRDCVNIAVIRALFDEHLKRRIDASAKLWAFTSLELSCRYLRGIS